MMEHENRDDCTLFVGNLDEKVTEEVLFELFLQAGPVKRVKIPIDHRSGRQQRFGFVTFKQHVSVNYSIELLNGIQLHKLPLKLNVKQKNRTVAQVNDEHTNHCTGNQFESRSLHDPQAMLPNRSISQNAFGEHEASFDPNYPPKYELSEMPTGIAPQEKFYPREEFRHHDHYRAGPPDRYAAFEHEHYGSPFETDRPPVERHQSHHHSASPVWNHDKDRIRRHATHRPDTPPLRHHSEIAMHHNRRHGPQRDEIWHETPPHAQHFSSHRRVGHRSSFHENGQINHDSPLHQQLERSSTHEHDNHSSPLYQDREDGHHQRRHSGLKYKREVAQDHKRRHRPYQSRDRIYRE